MAAKTAVVYECDDCGARFLGDQRCPDCNTWCQRIGPLGCCPRECDQPTAIVDLIDPEQLSSRPERSARATT